MKILLTGNNGYIGSFLGRYFIKEGFETIGLDSSFYKGCEFEDLDYQIPQIEKDIRDINQNDLHGVDTVVHLAALSNDPLGEFSPELTHKINYEASVRLAKVSKKSGVKRFIFTSSQGMYGIAEKEVDEDSPKNPLTAYASSKLMAEKDIAKLADKKFTPVFLRPTTVCGISPMLRCDILLNTMVANATTKKEIKVMGGNPVWRAVVHIEDLARAFLAVIKAPRKLVYKEAFNIGKNENNHTVYDFAKLVKERIPGIKIERTKNAGPDQRSYKVNFNKINTILKKYFNPKWTIEESIENLSEAFKNHKLTYSEIENKYIRINRLKSLRNDGLLDQAFYWKKDPRWFP